MMLLLRKLALPAMVAALSGCTAGPTPPARRAPQSALAPLMRPERPVVIAHRGGRTEAPEETMDTLRRSVAVGAQVLELDLHATADGVVVCMHDATVDRTTDGTGPIQGFDYDALRQLDAGHRFSPDGGASFPFRGQGVRVPTLAEVLSEGPQVPLVLEIKQSEPPIADAVMAELRAHDALDRVVLAAFSADTLEAVRAHSDAPATSLAVSEVIGWLATDEAPGSFLHLPPELGPVELVTPELIQSAEAQGLAVQVWTISTPAQMRAMIDLGVHGIMTPDPQTLAGIVASTP